MTDHDEIDLDECDAPECEECDGRGIVEVFHGDRSWWAPCDCAAGRDLDDEDRHAMGRIGTREFLAARRY